MSFKNRGLQTKLVLVVAAIMLLALAVIVVLMAGASRERIIEQARTEAHDRLEAAERLLMVSDEIISQRVTSSMALLQERGTSSGPARLGPAVQVGERMVPDLLLGDVPQANNFELVDGVTAINGGTATLFVRDGDDFVRIATNVMTENGRATGTLLSPEGRAMAAIRAGEAFYGQVDILGSPFLTGYAPVRDAEGQVIGIWYVGYQADLKSLENAITRSGVLTQGALLLIDDQGRLRMHTDGVDPQAMQALASGDTTGWVVEEMAFAPWNYRLMAAYPETEVTGMIRSQVVTVVLAGVMIFVLLVGALIFVIRRLVIRPLDEARIIAGQIAEGNLRTQISGHSQDEVGQLMNSLDRMQSNLKTSIDETTRLLNESLRIRMALDGVGTGVIIGNDHGEVIYTNRSVVTMLGKVESVLRERIPQFSADDLGSLNLNQLLCDEQGNPRLKSALRQTEVYSVTLGERYFTVTASPVINELQKYLGVATEWRDRTAEVNAQAEVGAMVAGAAKGDFSVKISEQGKEGFFLELAGGLNQLVDVTNQGLDDIARVLGAIARRDMTERVTAEYEGKFDELKQYCNQTSTSLGQMIGEIRSAAATIATAAQELSQGNSDLSSRTEEQASSLEQTASSMEELTSTVKQNADNAKQASALAVQAAGVAGEGGELVRKVVNTMEDISSSSQKIADIIGVIDGIAFQTNILALNAAVEAARAGDQGRGFAVVASEVRSLAQRSANAAKDIKGLISDSVGKIQSGDALVKRAGDTMAEIVKSIKRVSDINSEIAAASEEQASGIDNVSTAVNQMDEMTQQNAALVEEAAAASESQQEQVAELSALINQFVIDEQAVQQAEVPAARIGGPATSRSGARPMLAAPQPAERKGQLAKAVAPVSDEWEEF